MKTERLARWALLLPAAGLLALSALTILRELGAIHPLYTPLALAAVLAVALAARWMGDWRWSFALLAVGAVGLRVVFVLGWTVYPHEAALSSWNLALELSGSPLGQWPALLGALGGGLDRAFVVYAAVLVRLLGPSLLAVQLPGAVLGGLSCLMTALLALRLTGDRRAALAAGALTACCPTLLFSAGVLSGLPVYTFLLLWGLYLLAKLEEAHPWPALAAALLIGVVFGSAVGGGSVELGGLGELVRKVRYQFGSFNYPQARLDTGGGLRSLLIGQVMHPVLQGYMLAVLLLALAGLLIYHRERLLPAVAALGCLAAAMVWTAEPVRNGLLIPLLAIWAARPALQAADWVLLLAAPEKKRGPLPPALAAVRLVVSVVVYGAMLALVLLFFTGEGAFLYEAF